MDSEKQMYAGQGLQPPAYTGAPMPQPAMPPQGSPAMGQPFPQQPAMPPPGSPAMGQPFPQQGVPAAPPGYVPGQTVMVQQPQTIVVQQQQFRQSPVNCICPHCQQNIITTTTPEVGGMAWLICGVLLLFGCWMGCCFIPFCIDDCKDIRHSCPNCKKTIHIFNRM